MWMLNYQTLDGAFVETEHYSQIPLHHPMAPSVAGNVTKHVPLTAHALISLETSSPVLQVYNQYIEVT